MSADLPVFRLHPNAYRLGLFSQQAGICSCCDTPREWRYEGPFYARQKPAYLCPWCVADGSAAQRWQGQFNDDLSIEGCQPDPAAPSASLDLALLDEVCERTPGYLAWQQGAWLLHCGQPCQFLDYVDHAGIEPLRAELADDLDGLPPGYVRALSTDGSPTGYLFRCAQCGSHRLHTDCT
ncbi:hypothetical protein SAMN05216588_10378 [Pseudomonas flavescens]|uniref:CbrC family protein n=1 Tax=Phytopseudomonas flavescens TaxID=29435 RepID=A0A1G8A9N4_9GAMM|nr:CbrC family protein [Pseudomonas flavescens]SDH17583.1 hypothetical protein SAMN05216588_10378 [Pseudomonas flavescens]